MFREMLFAQRDLYDAYQVRDRNTVDPQKEHIQAGLQRARSRIQSKEEGGFKALPLAPMETLTGIESDIKSRAYYLNRVYNQNFEYYKIFNK